MKPAAVWREARRNVVTGTSQALLFGALFALVVVPLQLVDLLSASAIINEAIRYQAAGASVSIITAEGAIDGRACEALNGVEGVSAAGAIRASDAAIIASTLPSSPVPTWIVTPSFGTVVGAVPAVRDAGVLLGAEAADLLGVSAGDVIAAGSEQVPVAGTYESPSDGRRGGYSFAALAVETPIKPYDECWIDVWPSLASSTELLLTTMLPSSGTQSAPSIGQLNSTLGSRFDPFYAYSYRITALAAPVTSLLALIVGFACIRSRRVQHASALHAGVSHRSLSGIVLLETGFWAVPVLLMGSAAGLVVATTVPVADRGSLLETMLIHCALALLGAVSGVALGAASIRERDLFSYFKDR